MATAKRSITINAPDDKIFEYINKPTNLLEIWPSMVEAKDILRLPNGGNKFNWIYKMAGMHFEGSSEDVEIVPNQKIVSKTEGGIESTITWMLKTENGGTMVDFIGDYSVPIPLLGKLVESFIVKQNEHEAEVILANLKARMEV